MAAKRKIRFKTVNEKLTNINNLLNINSTTDSKIDKGVNSADIDSKKLKKSDSKDSTDGTLAESCNNKPKESEDVEENEDFQNSYVLTMSQFVDESDNEESVIFEPFSQVKLTGKKISKLFDIILKQFSARKIRLDANLRSYGSAHCINPNF